MNKSFFNNLILENFKAFKGEHVFDFTELNIFTGANNSGKSTIFKAIKFFTQAFRKGDFPMVVDLTDSEYTFGVFDDLVNKDSGSDHFKIGFYTTIGKIPERFKIMFSFKDGSEHVFGGNDGTAMCSAIEVFDNQNELFYGILSSNIFNFKIDDLDYTPTDEEIKKGRFELPFRSPTEGNCPGLLIIKMVVSKLEKYLPYLTKKDYSELLDQINSIKTEKGNWWLECFNEEDYHIVDYDITNITLEKFLQEINNDGYNNLGDYKLRHSLLFGSNREYEFKKYLMLSENCSYEDFVAEIFRTLFKTIKDDTEIFRSEGIIHVGVTSYDKRILPITAETKYLQNFLNIKEKGFHFQELIISAFRIFDIQGIAEAKILANSAFELQYISAVNDIHEMRGMFRGLDFSINPDAPKFNVADLGKGAAQIIGIILKILAVLDSLKKERNTDELENLWKENPRLKKIRKTILIEEPETYLHPSWQSKIADLLVLFMDKFVEYLGESNQINFIVETHSVYLIQKLQLLVAQGRLDSEKVNIVYFNPADQKEKCYRLPIRKDGLLKKSFGSGFYDEIANLTADILNAGKLN